MKKKIIAFAASFALFFTTAFCGISAPVYAAGSQPPVEPEIIFDSSDFYRDPETGYIGINQDSEPYSPPETSGGITPRTAIPSSYGSISSIVNTYPGTRNQDKFGTCWAHAAAACAEFDLVKNHGMPKSSADFSELQLAYLNYNTGKELPGLDGDKIYIPSTAPKNYLDVGGNVIFSMNTLAQWKCFSYESNLPYSAALNNSYYDPYSSKISSWNNKTYHNAAQLQNVRALNIKSDPLSVKQAIMEYGAVYISYCHDSNYYSYNGTALYYNPYQDTSNHDVVIVGWDDSISASKWPAGKQPSSGGAWLVRNSWSSGNSTASQNSYFYMSYKDASLESTAYVLDFEAYSSSDNIYQHDGSPTHGSVSADAAANIFTANSTMSGKSEKLDSVMLTFSDDENINYKIQVYTGVSSSNPTSGYLNSSATTTGWTSSKGIYTIPLKKPVYLRPGEKYSIVVTAQNGSAKFDIESSQAISYPQGGSYIPWFTTVSDADAGESFIKNYSSWYDTSNYSSYGNISIKALTVDSSTSKYKITYNMNGGTNSSSNPRYFLSTNSGTFTLKNPTRSGYHFLGWYTDSSFKNKVTKINYDSKTNKTLYAKWCSNSNASKTTIIKYATDKSNGSYKLTCSKCGKLKGTYTKYKVSSVKLNYTKLTYSGKNKSPVPVIMDSNGNKLKSGTDYTYKYNKSTRKNTGRYYVTITFKGKYKINSKKLYFTIVPKAPTSATAKLHGYNDVTVSWNKVTGATGYIVYYKKSTASAYNSYKITTSRTLKFNNLTGNTKYNFKIVPYYKSGDTRYKSLSSKVVSTTTLKKLNQPKMVKQSNGKVSLTWQSISGASGYQVYWSSKKTGSYNKLCEYSSKYVGVTFTVGKNVTYWYKTRAYKVVDKKRIYGPWSDPKAYTLK